MAIDPLREEVARLVNTEHAGRAQFLDDTSEHLQQALRSAWTAGGPSAQRAKDFLHGTWLGHPLHSALTDAPVGAWTFGVLMDAIGAKNAADRAFTFGVIAAMPTALAGATDWGETEGRQRRVGLMHAILNSVALTGFIGSIFARRAGLRALGIALSTSAYTVASTSAYLGGKLVYEQGTGIARTAFDPEADGFKVVMKSAELPEGALTHAEVDVDGTVVPMVLLRRGGEVQAMHGICNHWGAKLWEGTLREEDGQPCVECPWHASTFRFSDGNAVHGPATARQPRFLARLRAGNVEVRASR